MTFIQSTSESFIQPTVGAPASPSQRTNKKRTLEGKTQSNPKRAKTTETDDKIKTARKSSHSKKTSNPDEIPSPKSRKISVESSGGEQHHKAFKETESDPLEQYGAGEGSMSQTSPSSKRLGKKGKHSSIKSKSRASTHETDTAYEPRRSRNGRSRSEKISSEPVLRSKTAQASKGLLDLHKGTPKASTDDDGAVVSPSLKGVAEVLSELRSSHSPQTTPPDLSLTPAAISMPPPPPRTPRLSQGRSPESEMEIKLLKDQYIELGLRFAQFREQFGPKVQALKNELQEAQIKLLTLEMREPIIAEQLMYVNLLAGGVMTLSANLIQKQRECALLQENANALVGSFRQQEHDLKGRIKELESTLEYVQKESRRQFKESLKMSAISADAKDRLYAKLTTTEAEKGLAQDIIKQLVEELQVTKQRTTKEIEVFKHKTEKDIQLEKDRLLKAEDRHQLEMGKVHHQFQDEMAKADRIASRNFEALQMQLKKELEDKATARKEIAMLQAELVSTKSQISSLTKKDGMT